MLIKQELLGVCVDNRAIKRTGKPKYRAYITFQGKAYNLGTYTKFEKAVEVRKIAEEKIKEHLEVKGHVPNVFKALLLNDTDKIGELIRCRAGES